MVQDLTLYLAQAHIDPGRWIRPGKGCKLLLPNPDPSWACSINHTSGSAVPHPVPPLHSFTCSSRSLVIYQHAVGHPGLPASSPSPCAEEGCYVTAVKCPLLVQHATPPPSRHRVGPFIIWFGSTDHKICLVYCFEFRYFPVATKCNV